MKSPKISVIMSVFNAEKYLKKSIESILNQSFKNFEFIIINDGSTDKSLEIIKSYIKKDNRIKLISRENKGLIASLNHGLDLARGQFIARMDADDISANSRFNDQLNFLEQKKIDLCGTSYNILFKNKIIGRWDGPFVDNDIKCALIFMSPFAHPTVMFRRSSLKNIRYSKYKYAEDYQLWTDLAIQGVKMGNINRPLLIYRLHNDQLTSSNTLNRVKTSLKISDKYFDHVGTKNKDLCKYYKLCKKNSSPELFKKLFIYAEEYKKKYKISDDIFLKLVRNFLIMCKSPTLKIFLIYRHRTKLYDKILIDELFLFFLTLTKLRAYSYLYNFLFMIRKKIKISIRYYLSP
jgi:glycosyltransferase involved in cell wall biosynthesis